MLHMRQACLLLACALAAGVQAQTSSGAPAPASGQTIIVSQPVFQTNITLAPYGGNLVVVSTNSTNSSTDPNINLSARVNSSVNVGMYCDPGWLSADGGTFTYPEAGDSIYAARIDIDIDMDSMVHTQTDQGSTSHYIEAGNNTLLISPNDAYYRPTTSSTNVSSASLAAYNPYFICLIINTDVEKTAFVTFASNITNTTASLVMSEQAAAVTIFNTCCNDTNSCAAWKAINQANDVTIYSDICHIPGQICDSDGHLLRVDMHNFELNCNFPLTALSQFSRLQYLQLFDNPNLKANFTALMEALANSTTVQVVGLQNSSGITGTFHDPTISNLTSPICQLAQRELLYLDVSNNNLTGNIPECLFQGNSTMAVLHLDNNFLTGTLPDVFLSNSTLETLSVENNNLTGSIPPSLANCSTFVTLDLTNNSFSGTIPPKMGDIQTLTYMMLSGNRLTGSVPNDLATAPNLQVLDVKNNSLSVLPTSWYTGSPNMVNTSLINLRISFNKFTGSLPAALAQLPELTYLVANSNNFSGSLPGVPGEFANLRVLNISGNSINGTVPAALGGAAMFKQAPIVYADGSTSQQVFDASYNRLTGSLPPFLASSTVPSFIKSEIFLQGNYFSSSVCNNESFSYLGSGLCAGEAPHETLDTEAGTLEHTACRPALSSFVAVGATR
eukprot:jgi/Astpho2/1786/Aster-07547